MPQSHPVSNPTPFRPLNEIECNAILQWVDRDSHFPYEYFRDTWLDEISVSYRRHRGNFTICTLSFTYWHPTRGLCHEIRTGASRRHDKDSPNPLRGELESLHRAIVAKPITLP